MKLAAINQDPGIAPGRSKGAAVHVAAMRKALAELGHEVHGFDEPSTELLGARLELSAGTRAFDAVYERYALSRTAGLHYARARRIPHVLEVNAPLIDEARAYRELNDSESEVRCEAFLFENTSLIVAVSEGVADYCRARTAAHAPIVVQPNGIDGAHFHRGCRAGASERAGIPAGRFVLGFHGRLRPWHHFEGLARSAMALLTSGVDVHLFCLGRGDFARELGRATDELFPKERLTVREWLPYEEVGELIAACHALPLNYARGGPDYFSPIKLREAMAVGAVPVIPGLGDLEAVVKHERTGLVYSPGNEPELASNLMRLAGDRVLWKRLSTAAAASASQCTWLSIAREVLASLDFQEGAHVPSTSEPFRAEESA